MTNDERRERGKTICVSIAEDIGKVTVTTPGLGCWPEAWDIVSKESADFMELLLRWEQTGDATLIDPLRLAYDKLVSAWADAARLYELRKVS